MTLFYYVHEKAKNFYNKIKEVYCRDKKVVCYLYTFYNIKKFFPASVKKYCDLQKGRIIFARNKEHEKDIKR